VAAGTYLAFISPVTEEEKVGGKNTMSSFDKRAAQWISTSTISDKSKATLLNRMNVGVTNYKNVNIEDMQIIPNRKVDPQVDYAFQDQIAKALRKLAEGDKSSPLFAQAEIAQPAGARFAPSASRTTPKTTPRVSMEPAIGTIPEVPIAPVEFSNADERRASIAEFRFGEAPSDSAAPFVGLHHDDDDHQAMDAGTMDHHEAEMRRRVTMKRQSRHAISAEPLDPELARTAALEAVPKPPEVTRRLVKTLETHNLFSHLDDPDLVKVADVMALRSLKRGEKILLKGRPNDTFFIVVAGSCANTETKDRLNVGSSIGDVHLMYETPCEETVEAAVNSTQLCSIDRKTYQIITSRASSEKRARYEGFLSNLKFLQGLTSNEKLQLADALKTGKYKKGDKVIAFGEEGTWFNIIVEGVIDVIGRDENGKEKYVCSFGVGDCVGELEFLFKHRTVADCVAATPVVRTAKMTARHFEKVLGTAKEVLERQAENAEVYAYYRTTRKESL
jgi:CRP-like cAMP-binding protein